ncbi:Homeodomain-like protein [Xylaria arbuscula]|nr:Homeodomain-like protein [Xylaria arbuscula]
MRAWTQEEDALLRGAVEGQSPASSETYDWNFIAAKLPGRSNKQDCRKRWTCCIAPHIRKGPWDDDEVLRLKDAVGHYGPKWPSVAKHVGTRQPDQCARRWYEADNPNINRGRWSLFEDQMLQNAVQAHGRKWTEIVGRYFPDRTPIAARNR